MEYVRSLRPSSAAYLSGIVMWIIRPGLSRPYSFVALAILLFLGAPFAASYFCSWADCSPSCARLWIGRRRKGVAFSGDRHQEFASSGR